MAPEGNYATAQVRFCSSICGLGTVIYTEKKYVRLTEADIDRVRQIYFNWQTENFVEYAEPELYYAAHRDEIQGKGYSLVPSRYIEFIDRDTEIDYQSALSEMSDKFNALKKRWDANETELVNAFKILWVWKR